MIRFARARNRAVLFAAVAALSASAGVVAAFVLAPTAPPPRPSPAPRDLGAPLAMTPADASEPDAACFTDVCARPFAPHAIP